MEKKPVLLKMPLLITRGQLVFPTCDSLIEAGRPFSMKAIKASKEGSSMLVVASQKSPDLDSPTENDIFEIATIARITTFSDLGNFYRIHVSGLTRAKITKIFKPDAQNNFYLCNVILLDDKIQDKKFCEGFTTEIINIIKKKASFRTKNILLMNYQH